MTHFTVLRSITVCVLALLSAAAIAAETPAAPPVTFIAPPVPLPPPPPPVAPEITAHIDSLLGKTPLVEVRFNRAKPDYAVPIERAVEHVLMAKPTSKFTLLGRIPKSQDASFIKESQQLLSDHIGHIHQILVKENVKPEDIQQYIVVGSPSGFNEIAVHVE